MANLHLLSSFNFKCNYIRLIYISASHIPKFVYTTVTVVNLRGGGGREKMKTGKEKTNGGYDRNMEDNVAVAHQVGQYLEQQIIPMRAGPHCAYSKLNLPAYF